MFVFLRLTYFTQYNYLCVHPGYGIIINMAPFHSQPIVLGCSDLVLVLSFLYKPLLRISS